VRGSLIELRRRVLVRFTRRARRGRGSSGVEGARVRSVLSRRRALAHRAAAASCAERSTRSTRYMRERASPPRALARPVGHEEPRVRTEGVRCSPFGARQWPRESEHEQPKAPEELAGAVAEEE
jgi:hypothetical protein